MCVCVCVCVCVRETRELMQRTVCVCVCVCERDAGADAADGGYLAVDVDIVDDFFSLITF